MVNIDLLSKYQSFYFSRKILYLRASKPVISSINTRFSILIHAKKIIDKKKLFGTLQNILFYYY